MTNNRLFNLYEQKKLTELKNLLEKVHPDSEIKNGSTLLHKICMHVKDGDEQYVELLLKNRADPNKNVSKMGVPLVGILNSVMTGSPSNALPKVANLLIEHGAYVNCTPKALHMVAFGTKDNAVEMIHVLLKYGVNQANKNDAGTTPLEFARVRASNPAKYGVGDLRVLGNVIKALEYGWANYPYLGCGTQSQAMERRRAILQRYDLEAQKKAEEFKIAEIAKKQAEALQIAQRKQAEIEKALALQRQIEASKHAEEKRIATLRLSEEVKSKCLIEASTSRIGETDTLKENAVSHAHQIEKMEQDRADKIRLMIDSKHDFGSYGAFKLFYAKHKNLDLNAFKQEINASKSERYANLMNTEPYLPVQKKSKFELHPFSKEKALAHCRSAKRKAILDAILHQTKTDDPISDTLSDMHKTLDKHKACIHEVNNFTAASSRVRKHPTRIDVQSENNTLTHKEQIKEIEQERANKISLMINSKCDFGSYEKFKSFYYKYKELNKKEFEEQINVENHLQHIRKHKIEEERKRREQQYESNRQQKAIDREMRAAEIVASSSRHVNSNSSRSVSNRSSSSLHRSLDDIMLSSNSSRRKIGLFDSEISAPSQNTSMHYKSSEDDCSTICGVTNVYGYGQGKQ